MKVIIEVDVITDAKPNKFAMALYKVISRYVEDLENEFEGLPFHNTAMVVAVVRSKQKSYKLHPSTLF